jgi:beta-N-acetylhexosaminidase
MFGQIMMDLQDPILSPEESNLLQHPAIGGVILFQRNYESKNQIKDLINTIRSCHRDILIAVDQEGGRVQRFLDGFTRLPALGELGEIYERDPQEGLQKIAYFAECMASELLEIDVDFSFAPVLDLNKGISEIIGNRSFHSDPEIVSTLGALYVETLAKKGMAAVAKHFPGHGSVALDSHYDLPIDNRDLNTIFNSDLQSFLFLINKGLKALMPAHIVFPAIDDKPVGFSHIWLQTLLRERYGFRGAIFSDDLSMKGAYVMGDVCKRVSIALEAGCDMTLVCNDRAALIKVLDTLPLKPNPISHERLSRMRSHAK